MSLLDKSASKEQLIEILNSMHFPIMGAGGGFAPIGTINFFDASVAPQGWLACDGSIHNISDYPELATYYASVHGSSNFYGGNGTTTFAVPDLRGEFLRGTGTNSHTNQGSGANVGVHQDATVTPGYYCGNDFGIAKAGVTNEDKLITSENTLRYTTGTSYSVSGLTGNTFTSRPTNTSFLICVKATVSGDPNGHVYSTEEQVVGQWIDGKPVYERTIDFGALPNNSKKSVAHGIDNLDFVVSVNMFSSNNAYVLPIPYVATDNISNCRELWLDKTNISVRTAKDSSSYVKTYVIVRYTKTTD